MKLGVSYNIFDGEELLENSIKSIRKNVITFLWFIKRYRILVIHVTNLIPLINRLKNEGLVDEIFKYRPAKEEDTLMK